MSARIIDGKQIASDLREAIKKDVANLKESTGAVPGLGVILVGDDPASHSYVRGKEKACVDLGIHSVQKHMPAESTQEEVENMIDQMNHNPEIHGILLQLPLPGHLDSEAAIAKILPQKDVDGFHPESVGKMVLGRDTFVACTPYGVVKMLEAENIKTEGAHVVIVGRSNIVGKPLANLLIQKGPFANSTVTVCHTRTKDIGYHTRQADIVIAAAGRPNTVTADMVKEGAVIIDVGVNRVEDETKKRGYRLVGDTDFEGLKEKVSAITPVPGGVGPLTITMLMHNTVKAANKAAASTK